MTEKEKMTSGKIYDPSDKELVALRKKAHRLSKEYNELLETDERRAEILKELGIVGDSFYFQGSVQFDYGCFTSVGTNFYANFNFTCVDCCPVTIDDNVFVGPNVSLLTPIHPLRWQDRNQYVKQDGTPTDKEYAKPITIGSTWRNFSTEKSEEFAIRMVYEITERTTDANGQEMLFPETEIDMYWTSLGVSDEEVIALYNNHAVCEQYHSEIKTDMGVERLPSGKFETNALILKLTMIAYNILRIIGAAAMKGKDMPVRHNTIKRRRIRTVIDNLILIAGHLTDHARKLRLALGRSNAWIFFRVAGVV